MSISLRWSILKKQILGFGGGMKGLLFIIAGLICSWYFIDLEASSSFNRIFAPLLLVVFLIALAVWLVMRAGFGRKTGRRGGLGGDLGGFDGGGE